MAERIDTVETGSDALEGLATPFVLIPLVNNDNNQHSVDENLRIGHVFDGTRAFIGLVRTPL